MSGDGTMFRVILERYNFIGFAYSNCIHSICCTDTIHEATDLVA